MWFTCTILSTARSLMGFTGWELIFFFLLTATHRRFKQPCPAIVNSHADSHIARVYREHSLERIFFFWYGKWKNWNGAAGKKETKEQQALSDSGRIQKNHRLEWLCRDSVAKGKGDLDHTGRKNLCLSLTVARTRKGRLWFEEVWMAGATSKLSFPFQIHIPCAALITNLAISFPIPVGTEISSSWMAGAFLSFLHLGHFEESDELLCPQNSRVGFQVTLME